MEVGGVLAFTDADTWRLGIGDPTVMGWFTVLAYFATGILCLREVAKARHGAVKKRLFWSVLTASLFLLGINKQLDLQTLLTLTVRKIAISQGWYEKRRIVQVAFVLMIALGGAICAMFMRGLMRQHHELWLPLLGFVALVVFVIIRAASFHHVDQLINFKFAGVRMNWVLELGAIALVAWGTLRARRMQMREEASSRRWVAAQ